MAAPRIRIAGLGFDHMHIGDLLRMAHECPDAEIAGIFDPEPERMEKAIAKFAIPRGSVFTEFDACMEKTRPDLVILCPATARHKEWVEKAAGYGANVLVEKPFARNAGDARAMIKAMEGAGKSLAINWPMAWYPAHATCKRVLAEGLIGTPTEVHYYGGNRGPLFHGAGKEEFPGAHSAESKAGTWWYRKAQGGGSLQDYLGYGTTLGTWFLDGALPQEIMAMADRPAGLEVDEHSVTLARYRNGISKFETRWGTFTDPWKCQPQPKCGFVVTGTEGTVSSFDFEVTIRLQNRSHPRGIDIPVDAPKPPFLDPIAYCIHCINTGTAIEGPLSPALSLAGQRIVDSAALSALTGQSVPLVP